PNLKSASVEPVENRFLSFFERTQKTTGIVNASETMRIKSIRTDDLGMTHIKSSQYYKGVEIYGSESTLHLGKKNERFTGRIFRLENDLDVNPTISENGALVKTENSLKELTVCKNLTDKEKKILNYQSAKTNLVVYRNKDHSFSLAWEIEIRPNFIEVWKYFVDAHSGEIIRIFNATNTNGPATATAYDLNNTLRTLDTYVENGAYYLIDVSEPMFQPASFEGTVMTLDANNTSTQNLDYQYISSSNNAWNNKTAVSAHANVTATYKFLLNAFGRNSLNDKGNSIISFVNITNEDGSSMDNAFWNGEAAFFGNGSMFKPLAGAQDVVSHELGHGVVSNTANLEYADQSGAINETYADIFGSMVDSLDWKIGEDVVRTTDFPSGALRDMSNPHNQGVSGDNSWQPAHLSEMYVGDEDNGGVHMNSSIGNFAYYKFATATSKKTAQQVFYRALVNYLTKNSQFIDFRIAVVQAATDLYGSNSVEVTEAGKAFDQVGVYDETPVNENPTYEVNEGQEYLLSYNTNSDYTDKLDRTTTAGENFVQMTKTDMKGKPSVTDDGTVAAFVSLDDNIRGLVLDPNDLEEWVLSAEPFWDNVAVSKDGKRVAAISTEADASIYVYDFETEVWTQFHLYNPTTGDNNITAGGVLYADAIEFDMTGEYLIYDSYNEFNSTTNGDINYWDIGFIKVWDNQTNQFGDGRISKLFGSLPKDVSIGNPVFSKNSNSIIAFDYFDQTADEYAILGVNLETGESDVIYLNTTLGYPSFSRLDDKIAFSGTTTEGNDAIGVIGLAANKISASDDNASLLISDAKWPVYYTVGTRALGLAPVANFTADYKSGNAPFRVQFYDLSENEPTSWNWTFQGGNPSASTMQNPEVTYYTPGKYQVILNASNSFGENTSTKTSYIEVISANGLDQAGAEQLLLYPNPVTDYLNITGNDHFSVTVSNLTGQQLLYFENQKKIDLSQLSKGVYMVEIRKGDQLVRRKITKD
ncbi:MAG TPA: M4 family metallopeptidase, partial [Prolixibacteraceae bacterium]|nr:M4 family metallopeptidase [Prolixibacteraceae bacterium]